MPSAFIPSRSHAALSRQAASRGPPAPGDARVSSPRSRSRGAFSIPRAPSTGGFRETDPAAAAECPGDPRRPLRPDISFIPTHFSPFPWRGSACSGARLKRTEIGKKMELSEAIKRFCCICGPFPAEVPLGPLGPGSVRAHPRPARSVPRARPRCPCREWSAAPGPRGRLPVLENTDPSLTLGDGTKTAPCRCARHPRRDTRCARGFPR